MFGGGVRGWRPLIGVENYEAVGRFYARFRTDLRPGELKIIEEEVDSLRTRFAFTSPGWAMVM